MSLRTLDLLTMGRCSIDLYSNQPGAPFPRIESFGAFVGGCPTNIAVGTRRLGLKSTLLTAVGDDPVGEFVLRFLEKEGVDTRFIPRKSGHRTPAVVLGIEPPDRFPLVFYRERAPDMELGIDDVRHLPLHETRALLVTGTGLARDPSRSATLFALERARALGVTVFLDIDFRADQWHDVRAFGVNIRTVLPYVDVVFGTEAEVNAAVLTELSAVAISDHQISSPTVHGDLPAAVKALLARGPEAVVLKRGALGAEVHLRKGEVLAAPPFPVEVVNVLGAGDAFAAGFITGHLRGWGWQKAARLGNATGALVVTRQACANDMPTWDEVMAFVESRGGLS
jgi:5-dehydro-2-deoxygluconokinase